jgi:NADH:ubiquinone oxidoreductase subunit E
MNTALNFISFLLFIKKEETMSVKEILFSLEKDKSNIIKALQMVQDKEGYISEDSIKDIAIFLIIG